MTSIEHRRVATPSGVLTNDDDWPALRTLPTFGTDLEAGEIIELNPTHGTLALSFELYDGLLDTSLPIVGVGAATVSIEVITRYRNRSKDIYKRYASKVAVSPQAALTQVDMSAQGLSWVRLTTGASLPATAHAIWVFFDEVPRG